MAGERTPDTSDNRSTGSSDDDISLREHMQRQIDQQARYFERVLAERVSQLDERYTTQTKALDAALAAAEKAVVAALEAAEKAVAKAESASEKRFESVNEFRAQLADQANTFLARSEGEVRFSALTERIDANVKKITELELRVQSRLDLTLGQSAGIDKAWGYLVGVIGLTAAIIGIMIGTR